MPSSHEPASAPTVTGGRIGRNTFYNLVGGVLPLVVVLVTVPIYLRTIGEARYGILAIVWLIFGYFSMFDLGLSRATSNQIARLRAGKAEDQRVVFWTALAINGAFGVVGGALFWLVGGLLLADTIKMAPNLRDEVIRALPWMTLTLPVITISGVLNGTLEGYERFRTANIISVAGSVMFLVVPLLVALLHGPSLVWLIPAAVLTRLLFIAPLFLAALRCLGKTRFARPSLECGRRLIRYGSWVMATNIVGPILETADRILVGAVLGVAAVADYTIPFNLADRVRLVPAALSRTLFPDFSAKNSEQAAITARKGVRLLGKVFALVVAIAILGVHPFLSVWIDADFAARSSHVGEIILLGIWLNGLAFIPFALLQSQGRPDLTARIHVLELLPFLGILWIGVHWFGLAGAAVAWALRVAIDAVILFRASRLGAHAIADLWPVPILLFVVFSMAVLLPDRDPWKWLIGICFVGIIAMWIWKSERTLRDVVAETCSPFRRASTG